jgi:hypothetical protein
MMRAADNAAIRSAIGLGQTDAPTFLAQTLTGQSLTGTQATSLVDLATTWLSTTATPTAIKLNVTDTASNAASKLMDLQVGGVSRFNVDKNGSVGVKRLQDATGQYYVSLSALSHYQGHFAGGTTGALGSGGANWVVGGSLGFNATGDAINTVNLKLERDADGILAQRNGTAKQVHRVYNTFLGTTANEWGGFDWLTTTNTLRIGTEHGGTGTARDINFVTGGVRRGGITAATGYWDLGTANINYAIIGIGAYFTNAAILSPTANMLEVCTGTAGVYRDLRVRSVIQQPPATITPASNGDLVVEATSNTLLTFKFKGSDGTVRSGTMVVA